MNKERGGGRGGRGGWGLDRLLRLSKQREG